MRQVHAVLLTFFFAAPAVCQNPARPASKGATQAMLNDGFVYPQSFGAKCDGSSDDGPAFQAAVNAAKVGDTILVYSATSQGCVISTGFTISKPIALSTGAPGYPKAQFFAGANDITMITVSNTNGVKFNNVAFNDGQHRSVTGVSLKDATETEFHGDTWLGPFAHATVSVNSYFTSYYTANIHGALQGFTLGAQSNSTTIVNVSFHLGAQGYAIQAQNSQVLTVIGGTFECGSEIQAFNYYGVTIQGNYFENDTKLCGVTIPQYVSLGSSPGGAPVFGATITGNLFNGGANYGVQVGPSQGVEIAGNSFRTAQYAIAINTTGRASLNRDIHIGPNSYDINGAGYDETKIVTYLGGYGDKLSSNMTTMQFSPMLFPRTMPTPQASHVPTGDAAIYWSASNGALNMLYNNGSSYSSNFFVSSLESIGTSYIDGQAIIRPAGLTNTNAAVSVFKNNHDLRIGEESSTGGALASGSDPYAAVISTNDNYPVELGVGGVIRAKVTASSGSPNTVVCWKSDGKTLGYATVAEIGAGTCH